MRRLATLTFGVFAAFFLVCAALTPFGAVVLPTIAALQANTNSVDTIFIEGYNSAGDLGSGWFVRVASGTTNLCTIFQDAGGHYYQRQITGTLTPFQCGAYGNGTSSDTTAIQAAHNAALAVYYPTPPVKYEACGITLQPGAVITGEGNSGGGVTAGTIPPTIVECTTTAWIYTLQVPVNEAMIGPHFDNIALYCQNCVQLNNPANGQPGFNGTSGSQQGLVDKAAFEDTYFFNNNGQPAATLTTGTAIQQSVAFHTDIGHGVEILGFQYGVDSYYSDFVHVHDGRIWQIGTCAIQLTGQNTFGGDALIEHMDLLAILGTHTTGTSGLICSGYYLPHITHNYMEQTAAQGTGLTGCIVLNGAIQNGWVQDNVIGCPTTAAAHWLNVTTAGNENTLVVTGNAVVGASGSQAVSAIFNAGAGYPFLGSGGNFNNVLTHFGNSTEAGMPWQSASPYGQTQLAPPMVAIWTPGLAGSLDASGYGASAYGLDNAILIPEAASPGNFVTFQDPRGNLAGTFAVWVLAYASSAQVATWNILDNGSGVSSGSITLTTSPKWFELVTSQAIATNLSVQITGATSGSNVVSVSQINVATE